MAHFLRHSSCPECGSRDNLALYSDGGGHCFGCGYHIRPTAEGIWKDKTVVKEQQEEGLRPLPIDFGTEFSEEVLTWCKKYDILVPELLYRNVGYSPSMNQLIFTWKEGNRIALWQARNFYKGRKKYFTGGEKDDVLPIYPCQPVSNPVGTLVLVEDAISAIKIARQCDAMPILGATLSPRQISALKPFYGFLVVWLDGNKYDQAQKIARQAELIGIRARAIYTEVDPKEYDDEFIKEAIR